MIGLETRIYNKWSTVIQSITLKDALLAERISMLTAFTNNTTELENLLSKYKY